MPISLQDEDLVDFASRHKLPGPAVTHGQLRYWLDVGIKVDGEYVRLEALRIGGRRYTSISAYRRFIERLNGAHVGNGGGQ